MTSWRCYGASFVNIYKAILSADTCVDGTVIGSDDT